MASNYEFDCDTKDPICNELSLYKKTCLAKKGKDCDIVLDKTKDDVCALILKDKTYFGNDDDQDDAGAKVDDDEDDDDEDDAGAKDDDDQDDAGAKVDDDD